MERTTSTCETIDNGNHDLLDLYRDLRQREDSMRNIAEDYYKEINRLQKLVDKQDAIIDYLEEVLQVQFKVHPYRGVLISGNIENVERLHEFIKSIEEEE